jgi:polar amino acid transport system substrate-binding protein
VRADTIRLRADAYCPTNCGPGDPQPGYAVEIAREVFARAGHSVEYELLAWQRAIADTEAGLYDGVIGAGPGEVPGFVLGAEPIGVWQLGVAVRRGQAFRLDPERPFEGLVVGAVEGYGYGEEWIEAYLAAHSQDPERVQLLSGPSAIAMNLKKLVAGRVDCVPDSTGILRYHAHELGLGPEIDVLPAPGERSDVFIAFAPNNPRSREWAALLDAGIAELRANGRLARILAAYGLRDWR